MNNGWIKLHRKSIDNPIHQKPAWFSLWIHLLILAQHEEHDFIWNDKKQIIKTGQLLTGRKKLALLTGISETTIERVLNYLETEHQIGQQKTSKYRLITILNWDKYQKMDSVSDNKRTTNGQQTDTYKNVKNVKNEKNTSNVPLPQIQSFISLFKNINPSYERLFGNVTERSCAERLLSRYGYEKMERTLISLPDILGQPYAPRITTPYELEKNLGKLLQFIEQNKNITKIKQPKVIFS